MVDVLREIKSLIANHRQELRFSKVSNVYIINSSFGNPHLTLILINQCLTIMFGSGTVINIFPLPNHDAPLQLIKCSCSKFVCVTSRCKCKANHLYMYGTDLC